MNRLTKENLFGKSDEIEMAHALRGDHADKEMLSQLQNEMKEMMTQLINQQCAGTSTAANLRPVIENTIDASTDRNQSNVNTRQASIKEIGSTLPEFYPSDKNAISVEQFIERVDNVISTYKWEDKLLLIAICSQLK